MHDTIAVRLMREGILELVEPYAPTTIERWNRALDPAFATDGDERRSYVGAGDLAASGVLGELFNEPLRDLVQAVMPTAVLYHCHAYEIAAGQQQPHISAERLDGWHRDKETVTRFASSALQYLSVFVYLSPVGEDSGAFELLPRPPRHGIHSGDRCTRVLGPVGTTFAWNRTFYHRASPNRSSERRRVLKLSLQPAAVRNDRIGLPEFADARDIVTGGDPLLARLLAVPAVGAPPLGTGPVSEPAVRSIPPTHRVAVSRRDEVIHRMSKHVLAR